MSTNRPRPFFGQTLYSAFLTLTAVGSRMPRGEDQHHKLLALRPPASGNEGHVPLRTSSTAPTFLSLPCVTGRRQPNFQSQENIRP